MPSVGPFEVALTAVYGLVAFAIMVLFLYSLIVLAARLLHRVMPATQAPPDPALATLRDRFARGEIDEAEYRHQRAVLQGS